MRRLTKLLFSLAILAIGVTPAQAFQSYLTSFTNTYPAAAAALGQCVLCHIDPAGGGTRNGYGNDYASNGHNFKTIEPLDSDGDGYTNLVEIQALTYPGDATSFPTTPPPPVACTSSVDGAWGSCVNGIQTRTVTGFPAGCTGGVTLDPTTQACSVSTPCTSSIDGAWGACVNGIQTRTVTGSPAGCTGGVTLDATTQNCSVSTACTASIDGAWGACVNGVQTRTVSGSPAGCTGGVTLDPTTRACSNVPGPTPVGYNPIWLIITLVSLTLAGGYLLRKRMLR